MKKIIFFLIWVLLAVWQYIYTTNKKIAMVNNQTQNLRQEYITKQKDATKKYEELWQSIIGSHMSSVRDIIESNQKSLETLSVVIKDFTVAYRDLNQQLIMSKYNQSFMNSANYKNIAYRLYKTTLTIKTDWKVDEVLEYEGLPPWFDCTKYNMDFCFSQTYNNKIILPLNYKLFINEVKLPYKRLDFFIDNINKGYDFKNLVQ